MSEAPPNPNSNQPPAPGAPGDSAPSRPDWLPEAHWDAESAAIKPEFGQHYAELATFHQTETQRQAELKARKPEDVKIEVKLPEGIELPNGPDGKPLKVTINESDPRIPMVRELALKHGWTQDQVNDLVAFDAIQQINAFKAEQARIAEETKKLGDKAPERRAAVDNWLKGLVEKQGITREEYEEARVVGATAAGVSLLEKLMAKVNGSV